MPFAALAGAAIGGIVSGVGSIIGGGQQASAADNATNAQLQMFNQLQQELQPFQQAGAGELPALEAGIQPGGQFNQPFDWSKYTQSPGYQFQLQQGMDAITNSAAARGGIFGGNTLKALQGYGQGLAAQDYTNQRQLYDAEQQQQFQNAFGLTQLGEAAAANVGAGAIQTGQGLASTALQRGNALSAETGGIANSLTNFLNQPGAMDFFANLFGGGSSGPGGSGFGTNYGF